VSARPALAQTIQPFQDIAVTRNHEADNRPSGKPYYYISREDCLADDVLTFDLRISNPDAGYTFQVWASDGEDCSVDDERSVEQGNCWLVYSGTIDSTTAKIQIPVRNIAAALRPRTIGTAVNAGDEASCSNDIDAGITLYFMHVSSGSVHGGTPATWQTRLDLKGPAAPDNVNAGIGDKRLVVSWDVVSGDKTGYRIYCEESTTPVSQLSGRYAQVSAAQSIADGGVAGGAGGSSAATSSSGGASGTQSSSAAGTGVTPASTSSAAGSGGASSGSNAACATNLVEGQLPPTDAQVCGKVDVASSDSGTAANLQNSVVYAVAVSAVDELGNPGPLSNVDCQAPENLDEFFEAYRRGGGKGGGGFCSMARHGSASSWGALFWLCGGLGLLWWRRQ
jgi:hypothetical protein